MPEVFSLLFGPAGGNPFRTDVDDRRWFHKVINGRGLQNPVGFPPMSLDAIPPINPLREKQIVAFAH